MFRSIRLVIVGFVLLCGAPVLTAQSYHLYRPVGLAQQEKSSDADRVWAELEAAGVASYGTIRDRNGDAVSHRMYGARGQVLVYLTDWMAIGLTGEQLQAADMQTQALSTVKRNGWGLITKWVITPQTQPRLYVVGAAEYVKQQTQLSLSPVPLQSGGLMVLLGIGVQVRLWKGLYVDAQAHLQRDEHPWDNFVLKGPRTRCELIAGLHYQI